MLVLAAPEVLHIQLGLPLPHLAKVGLMQVVVVAPLLTVLPVMVALVVGDRVDYGKVEALRLVLTILVVEVEQANIKLMVQEGVQEFVFLDILDLKKAAVELFILVVVTPIINLQATEHLRHKA
jgi:hypothetical protein